MKITFNTCFSWCLSAVYAMENNSEITRDRKNGNTVVAGATMRQHIYP
jgi:hypothetical protein